MAKQVFVWDDETGQMVEKTERRQASPYIIPDIEDYVSPVTGKVVSGRVQRRDDLKAAGAREVDPSEYTPTYSDRYYEKRGLPLPEGRRQLSRREI